jgi:Na+-transporting NADH:ubiquinone oxidoreductase subunit NqrF
MFDHPRGTSDTLASLQEAQNRLADLLPRLQSANHAFAEAARPLDKLSELDSNQKRQLALSIRAAKQEWEEVTQLIHQVLAKAALPSNHSPPAGRE